MTVSRTISFPDLVSQETRDRVSAAIAATGYIPNKIASSFASNRTRMIGAVIPTLRNSIAAAFTDGLRDILRREGYHVLLGDSGFDPEHEETLVAEFLARRVDGVYLTGSTHTERTRRLLQGNAIPTVEIASLPEEPVDMAVGFSNYHAGYAVTQMFAAQGYRKVALFTTFIVNNERQAQRRNGYRAAVNEFGLDEDPALMAELGMDLNEAAIHLRALLDRRPDVEGLFCTGDFIAAGALLEAHRLGVAVPKALAIAGFDGLEIAENLNPSLTTVHIPRYRIGAQAGQMLLARINGDPVEEMVVDLGFEIVMRQSTNASR